jgi:hypothetical protein
MSQQLIERHKTIKKQSLDSMDRYTLHGIFDYDPPEYERHPLIVPLKRKDTTSSMSTNQGDEGTCYSHAKARLFLRNVLEYKNKIEWDITEMIVDECFSYMKTDQCSTSHPNFENIDTSCTLNGSIFVVLFWILYDYFKDRSRDSKNISDCLDELFTGNFLERFLLPKQVELRCYKYVDDFFRLHENIDFTWHKFIVKQDFIKDLILLIKTCIDKKLYVQASLRNYIPYEHDPSLDKYHTIIITSCVDKFFIINNSWNENNEFIKMDDFFNLFELEGDITEWEVIYLISILPLPKGLLPQYSNGNFVADTIPKIEEITTIINSRAGGKKTRRRSKKYKSPNPHKQFQTQSSHQLQTTPKNSHQLQTISKKN